MGCSSSAHAPTGKKLVVIGGGFGTLTHTSVSVVIHTTHIHLHSHTTHTTRTCTRTAGKGVALCADAMFDVTLVERRGGFIYKIGMPRGIVNPEFAAECIVPVDKVHTLRTPHSKPHTTHTTHALHT